MRKRVLCSDESVFLDHTKGAPSEAPRGNTILIDEDTGTVYFGLDGKWYKNSVERHYVNIGAEVENGNLIIYGGATVNGTDLELKNAAIEGTNLIV